MSTTGVVIALIILLIILIIGLVFLSRASTALGNVDISKDKNLTQARRYILGGSITGWLLVIIIIFGGLYFYAELAEYSISLSFILGVVILLMITVGVLASLAASSIGASNLSSTDAHVEAAYSDSVTSSALLLGTLILSIILIVVYYEGRSSSTTPSEHKSSETVITHEKVEAHTPVHSPPLPHSATYTHYPPPPHHTTYIHH